MALRLYNTLTRKLEEFKPIDGQMVGLYSCGPTVYAPQHIGNMRYFLFVDVLKRTLQSNGLTVKHVMNITDVGHLTSNEDTGDDKMESAARTSRQPATEIAKSITERFLNDLRALQVQLPDVMPYATKTIDWQVALIQGLEQRGFTYRITDGLYFDTAKLPSYGQLSRQKSAEKKAGARVEINTEKRNSTDFALWKFSKPEDQRQMEWPSPWGTGFPGWHIECSAMSLHEFPGGLDIHCGGIDHIAVHHENEIAQNEASGHHHFVKTWMHGEFLVLPGKRMGKSEGNAITLQDVVEHGIDPLAFRYLCLQTHYRQQLRFSWETLQSAQVGLQRLWDWVGDQTAAPAVGCAEFEERFQAAINNDLNTAQALAVANELIASTYPPSAKLQTLSIFDRLLGLDLTMASVRRHVVPVTPELQRLLDEREAARKTKDWAAADRVRAQFEAQALLIDDTPDGPRLRKK